MQHTPNLGGKFLTFFLAAEEYGIEILKVQEIIGMMRVTPVPRTPSYMRGVINLRGKVISILDLRRKFGMPEIPQTEETCIIVVRAQGIDMGLVVDQVSEVLDIATEDIDSPPSFGADINTTYILGVGKAAGTIKLLLAIDRVISSNEVIHVYTTSGVSQANTDAVEPLHALVPA